MTRLTEDIIKDVPSKMSALDIQIKGQTGMDLRQLACYSAGITDKDMTFRSYSVAIVPMTSGKGVIGGFSDSVAAAIENIGMKPFITHSCDVTGVAEAISSNADIIFMADDERFIALNTRSRTFSDNIWSTAKGYVSALKLAEGSLMGKTVLVVGAGRVGGEAVRMLRDEGANVEVTDILFTKAKGLEIRNDGVKARADVEQAIRDNRLIFNASPGAIPGHLICEDAVISSPGVPFAFDEEGKKKAKMIIHDVLGLGVAVMAVASASTSLYNVPGDFQALSVAIP